MNEADNETMLVTIGEYKALVAQAASLNMVKATIEEEGKSAYTAVGIIKKFLRME